MWNWLEGIWTAAGRPLAELWPWDAPSPGQALWRKVRTWGRAEFPYVARPTLCFLTTDSVSLPSGPPVPGTLMRNTVL